MSDSVNEKVDRRIVKTEKAISKAFLKLATEKDVNKISVLELCREAEINKSTFYLHYKSMSECINDCFDSLVDEVVEFAKGINYYMFKDDAQKNLNIILDQVEDNLDYFVKFKNSSKNGFAINVFKKKVTETIFETNGFNKRDNYKQYLTIVAIVGAVYDAIFEPLPEFNREKLADVLLPLLSN